MSYYFWSGIVNAATSFLVAALVFLKNRQARANQLFIVFAASVGFWAVFYAIWIQSMAYEDASAALLWIRLAMIGSTVIPPAFTEFVISLLHYDQKWKKARIFNLSMMVLILALSFSPYFIKSVSPILSFRFWPNAGPFFYVFHAWFGSNVVVSQVLLIGSLWKTKGTMEWKRNFGVFIGTLIGFVGGMTNHFLWYKIPIPPIGNILVAVYVATVAFSIVRYRLLDIEIIIKKTLVFAGFFVMFMIVVSSVTAISQSFVGQYFKMGMMANGLMCALFVALLYNPTHKLLINVTDKYLFQKKEDFKVVLNRLAKNIISILNLLEVGETVLNTLQESLRLETGTLILRDEKNKHYGLLAAFNLNQVGRKFPSDSEFIRYFSSPDKNINLEEPDAAHALPNEVVKNLEALKAVICVPLFTHGELIGLLTMGKKMSDQEFTREEIDYLPVVASQTAIALKKAQLVENVIQEREGRVKAENEAKMVAYAKSIAHEIKNALAGVYEPVQFLTTYGPEDLKKILRWVKENKSLAVIEKKLLEIIEYMKKKGEKLQTKADEITIVAKTAESTLSSDETVFSEVNIRVLWDATLASVKKSITIKTFHEIEAQLFPYGNVVLLRRVLINLINNAIEALGKRDDGEIFFQAYSGAVEGKDVAFFEITDNGPGIQPDIWEEVFEQGFSTKPKPKSTDIEASGHGQGLWVCKHVIEEIHHGNIRVASELGKGTTFKMWIPIKGSQK